MAKAVLEISRRIVLAENERSVHRAAHHLIEAAACEIRIQALREAKAIIGNRALPPNEMRQSRWYRSAEVDVPREGRDGEG